MTFRLEIKDWHSPDVAEPWNWEPGNLEEVYFLLDLRIGSTESDSADDFQVVVATPEGLRAHPKRGSIVIEDRATLIVEEFSWKYIEKHITSIVKLCESQNYSESALKLQRYFQWEYEDYIMEE